MEKPTETHPFIKFQPLEFSEEEMSSRVKDFYANMNQRRTVRDFSDRPVPKSLMEDIIRVAGTAPSGAHKQPWTFCLVSNKNLKTQIRTLAEEEERKSYGGRMSEQWLKDIEPLGTNAVKPFLEIAPWLIVVFRQTHYFDEAGNKHPNYYVNESTGIAVGFLLAAIHHAGLVALTHTPSPMNFLSKALHRPDYEKPYLLIPVGYPAKDATVPDISRKGLSEIISYEE